MSVRDRRIRRRGRTDSYEEVDPMNFVSNLSDVMLILAVGIMVALILHWQVPVGQKAETQEQQQQEEGQDMVTFSDNDLDNQQEMPEAAQEIGNVYYDEETGTYYILQND